LDILEKFDFKNFIKFMKMYLNQSKYILSFYMGNITKEESINLSNEVLNILKLNEKKKLLKIQIKSKDIIMKLKNGHTILQNKVFNETELNSSIEIYYQIGLRSPKIDALTSLFVSMINSPYYEFIRTKNQIGK
jgi:secreted Zn-dependent insulinase-like peptidase